MTKQKASLSRTGNASEMFIGEKEEAASEEVCVCHNGLFTKEGMGKILSKQLKEDKEGLGQ